MSHLFSPASLGALELPNRIVVAPMCQYSADDGRATDWHLIHYGQLAMSGAGLVIVEATAVEPAGRITPQDLGLWSDDTEAALRRMLDGIRRYSGMPLAIQLAHAGRKASSAAPWDGGQLLPLEAGGWPTVAPSPIPHADGERSPAELDEAGLARIRDAFAASARRAARLGFDAIELHAAHGYLLHQFLSPLSNRRSDAYGGPLENRLRFPLEVFDAVRAAFPPEKPVGVRVSATDWVEGGWDLPECTEVCELFAARGAAFLHVSSGGLSPHQKIPAGPGYQIPLAESIRLRVTVPVIGVGLVTEPEQAESIVADGKADLVALARGVLWDPRWAWHAAAKLGAKVAAPRQYWRCEPTEARGVFDGARIGQR